MVVGGLAVYAYGGQRVTHDVDLVIQLEADNVHRAFVALEKAGYRPHVPINKEQFGNAETRERLIADKNLIVLNFWSDDYKMTRLDVFVFEPFDFDVEYARARREVLLPGIEFCYPQPDTLIEMKRKAGRPKDLEDIAWLERYAKP